MGQTIKKRWFWRKKPTRGLQPEQNSIWVDIAIRTGKTFLQVLIGIVTTLLVNPPDKWKPALTGAASTAACVAMNYALNRIKALIGDPDAHDASEPEIREEDNDVPTDQQTGEG